MKLPLPILLRLVTVLVVLPLLADCACGQSAPPDECQTETDCEGGAVCARALDGHLVCAAACGAENPCPQGSACVDAEGGFGCFAITGDKGLGERCQSDTECLSGACVGDASDAFCAKPCEDDEGCAASERCYVADHRQVCLEPLDDRATGEACETPRQCSSARCVRFLPQDELGVCLDGCVVTEGCTQDRTCVALESGAHVCVTTSPDGAACTSPVLCERGRCITDTDGEALCTGACEPDGTCSEGWACVEDSEGAPICMPLVEQRAAGEDCSSARECASGHCARFATDTEDYGTLCADPCLEEQTCADETLVCWEVTDELGLCGPFPS